MHTLTNARGTRATIVETGATLVGLEVRDSSGALDDIVLGFDSESRYQGVHPFFGSTVGRYANRIGGGRFRLGTREIRLAQNDGPNHLHGGPGGFHTKKWRVEQSTPESIALSISSPDGDEGYPGRLDVHVRYALTPDDDLRIEYSAATDAETVVNLTNHAYFNLGGTRSADVLDHVVMIAARAFTPVDANLIPTGEVRTVTGSALDFTRPTRLGERIDADEEQMRFAGGYDHNYVLDGGVKDEPALAARVLEPATGRVLEVWTTEPGIQFYSGNHLDGIAGKGERRYARRSGFCLEAQRYPDSPNHASFPSAVLHPGEPYRQTTIYRLRVE